MEMKYWDRAIQNAVVGETALIWNLGQVDQGNGPDERIGRKMTIKSINLRVQAQLKSNSAADSKDHFGIVRLMVVLDTQTNGVQFGINDLLTYATSSGAANLTPEERFGAFRNLASGSRFKVLMNKFVSANMLANSEANGTTTQVYYNQFYKNCNVATEWGDTTGVIANQKTNSIWFVAIASRSAAADAWNLRWNSRIRFKG